jgi:SNF2 family DNA or RNA helicase
MLDWANPEALGTLKEWTKYVSKPLAIGQSKNSKDIERIRAKVCPILSWSQSIRVNQLRRKSPQSLRTNYSPNISSAGTFGFQLHMPKLTLPNKDEGYYQSSGNGRSFYRLGGGYLRLSQLPHKFDRVVFCPLTETQTAVYERLIQTPNVQNILRRNEECDCGSKKPYVWFPNYADRETQIFFCPADTNAITRWTLQTFSDTWLRLSRYRITWH